MRTGMTQQKAAGLTRSAGLLLLVALSVGACARRNRVGPERGTRAARDAALTGDATKVYEQMGLLAAGSPVPFVGSVAYLAGTRDTTTIVLSFSMPNQALSFTREGDRYRAAYEIRIDLRQGSANVRHIETQETVRVASFRETSRPDESVIFQQVLSVPPGQYVLAVAVRDPGSSRTSSEELLLTVPSLGAGKLSTPIAVFDAVARSTVDSIPRFIAQPRATVTFGRDTVVPVYVEGYGEAARIPLIASVTGERGVVLWRDSVDLVRTGSVANTTLRIPASRLGLGVTTLTVRRPDTGDSTKTPLFVSFGDDLPLASYEEMLNYLRYFTTAERLDVLRRAPVEARAREWAAFLAETDPQPSTPQHEALTEYFARVRIATDRFREEGLPGWITDRGMVFITLGEPEQIYEQGGGSDMNQRGRAQAWEYREHQIQLVFVDQTGFGRWRLTNASEADFRRVAQRTRTRK